MRDGLAPRPAVQTPETGNQQEELLSALAGKEATRECAAAHRTRNRAIALAVLLLMVLSLGPFLWRLADEIFEGEQIGDIATQIALWACILSPAILAAVLVAGWLRKRP
jgi:hypothetical protein